MSKPQKIEDFKTLSLGACADRLHELREKRRAMQKEVDAVEAVEKAIEAHIIDTLPKGDGGAVGKNYKAMVVASDIPTVKEWSDFYKFIVKTKRFDLLQKRLSTAGIVEYWDAGKVIPGVGKFTKISVSLTKV